MRAALAKQPKAALRVAEQDQVFAQEPHSDGWAVGLGDLLCKGRGYPIAAHQLAHGRPGTHAGEQVILFSGEHQRAPSVMRAAMVRGVSCKRPCIAVDRAYSPARRSNSAALFATAGGVRYISSTKLAISLPLIGSKARPARVRSATNSLSCMVLSNPSRSRPSLSSGMPGGAASGRSIARQPKISP